MNIRDMFRLMVEFDFNFMINSQILWGDYDTVPALAIYQLVRPENAKYVTVIPYIWNGKSKKHGENCPMKEQERKQIMEQEELKKEWPGIFQGTPGIPEAF